MQRCYDLEKHQKTSTCKKISKRRENERKQDLQAEADKVEFFINGKKIERVHRFKYLGRWLCDNDDDTGCIMENIKKARQRWNNIANILKREGANAECMGKFYLVIVQSVLLYGADSWVITARNMGKLQSFHNRVLRHITGEHIRKQVDKWYYPNHADLMSKTKLLPIEKYIERRRGTLRRYLHINRRELLQEAEAVGRHCYDPNKVLWWKQTWIEKCDFQALNK